MTGLFGSQQVAGAADLKIAHGDLEAAAQVGKFPDGFEALFRFFFQDGVAPVHKKCVGGPVGAAYPPPELVKLRQSEVLGVVDDDGVGVGNVQPGLNDGGGHQHIDFFIDKGKHDLFQLPLAHLTVGKFHHGAGYQFLHIRRHAVNVVDPVVHIEDLPAPGDLSLDGFPYQLFVVLQHIGLNGAAVHRRHLQHAHIADARQTHVERPGDRCGGQRQHIHIFLHLFNLFFLFDAETLFFVDDEQSQVFVLDALGKYLVGADDNVHGSFFQRLLNLLCLLRCAEAGQHTYFHRIMFHPLHKGVINLLGEDGGRYQIDNLFALHHRLEGRADGDFCLAVSHVAADQAVHDLVALHVPLGIFDGGQLIFRLFVREEFLKLRLPDRIRTVGVAFPRLPLGVKFHQVFCGDLHLRANPRLGLLPLISSQLI